MDQSFDNPADGDQVFETPEEPREPQLVRVRIEGKTYLVPEDAADAIQAREVNFNRKLTEHSDELGQLRQIARSSQRQPESDQTDVDFWSDPEAYFERKLERERLIRRQEEALAKAANTYWTMFYRKYPHFVGKEQVVEFVLSRLVESIKHLPPEESQAELAQAVDELLGRQSDQDGGQPLPKGPVSTERSTGAPPARRTPNRPNTPDVHPLMKRKAERLAARYQRSKE